MLKLMFQRKDIKKWGKSGGKEEGNESEEKMGLWGRYSDRNNLHCIYEEFWLFSQMD